MKMSINLVVVGFYLCSIIQLSGQTITQAEFLLKISSSHPLFEKEKLTVQVESRERDSYLGNQDWMITSGPYYARQNIMPPSAFSPEKVDQMSFGAGASKAYWKTGGRLSVGWASDYQNQHGLENMVIPFSKFVQDMDDMVFETGEPKYYQTNVVISYTQPLLQNYKGELDRLGYEMGEYSTKIAEVQALENKEEFLLSMGLKYQEWVFLSEQKSISIERLHLAQQQLEQIKKKRAANLVDEVDVLRAEDAVRITEQGIVLINAQYKGKQAEMATLSDFPELMERSPEFDLYQQKVLPSVDEAIIQLQNNSRLLKLLDIRKDLLNRQQAGLQELTKPQLYLNTQLALIKGGSDFSDAIGIDKSDLGVSLQFSYPLGNRSALAKVQKVAIQKQQVQTIREEIALQLEAGLRNLLIQMEEYQKALVLNKEQIESARLKTQEELKRYNQGRGDLAFVIQSQDNEERAKLNYAQNAFVYQGLYLRFNALVDELLPENSVESKQ